MVEKRTRGKNGCSGVSDIMRDSDKGIKGALNFRGSSKLEIAGIQLGQC